MSLKICSKGSVAEIEAPPEALEGILGLEMIHNFIPLAKEAGKDERPDVFVYAEKGVFGCKVDYPNAQYSNGIINPLDLAVLAGHLLERARQERGIYCLHSNSVDINGEGIVIFGPPHSGKTTLSLVLAKAGKGKVISNESTLITKDGRIESEVKTIKLNSFTSNYVNKEDAGGLIGYGNPAIKMMVHPCRSADRNFVPYRDVESIVWDMIDQTDVFIRGVNKSVRDGDGARYILPSLDTEALAQQRYADLKNMFKGNDCLWCYSAIGDFPEMAEDILFRLKHNESR